MSSVAMRIVEVEDDAQPQLAAYLRVGDKAYPIASYDHVFAPAESSLTFKGPLYAALYQERRLTERQRNLIDTTLKRTPEYLDKLYAKVSSTTSYRVLFHNAIDGVPTAEKKRKRR